MRTLRIQEKEEEKTLGEKREKLAEKRVFSCLFSSSRLLRITLFGALLSLLCFCPDLCSKVRKEIVQYDRKLTDFQRRGEWFKIAKCGGRLARVSWQ